jgi:hypothetical protein
MRCGVRGVNRTRCKRRAKHRFHSLNPFGHTFAQKQGKPNAASLVCSSISLSCVSRQPDNLRAKQFVLHGILREVELYGFYDHWRFFSSRRR